MKFQLRGTFNSHRLHFKGGGGKSTTNVSVPKEQKDIFAKQLQLANTLESKGELNFFPGDTLAQQSSLTGTGQQLQLGSAQQLLGNNPTLLKALEGSLNAGNEIDPRTERLANAVTKPLEDNLVQGLIPSINSNAVQQGAFGGDRVAIERNKAREGTAEAIAAARAGVFENARIAGQQERTQALGLSPAIRNSLMTPGQQVEGIGSAQEARSQAEIDAARERFEFQQFSPTDLANRVNNLLTGINFGTSTTSKTSGGK